MKKIIVLFLCTHAWSLASSQTGSFANLVIKCDHKVKATTAYNAALANYIFAQKQHQNAYFDLLNLDDQYYFHPENFEKYLELKAMAESSMIDAEMASFNAQQRLRALYSTNHKR